MVRHTRTTIICSSVFFLPCPKGVYFVVKEEVGAPYPWLRGVRKLGRDEGRSTQGIDYRLGVETFAGGTKVA